MQIAIGLIVNKQNEILIAKREFGKHLGGFWEFPGGKLEPGEESFSGLQRELQEEVGIEIQRGLTPWMRLQHDYGDRLVDLDFYLVREFSGSVRAVEGQEICWVKVEHLDKYEFPAANQPVIVALQ